MTGSNSIAIGANVVLKVAGPALQPGACVGWSVSSGHVQINHAGFYQGLVEAVTRVGVGLRIAIRFGDARIHALVGYTDHAVGSLCRFDIDPDAARVWPRD